MFRIVTLSLLTLISSLIYGAPTLPEFVIVIPSYNNEKWCVGNLESVVKQEYSNYSIWYINDCSTDRTNELVDEFVRAHNLEDKITVIHNSERKGALQNIYETVHKLNPNSIVVQVDGDDELAHPFVLKRLASAYKDPNIWLTYGNWRSKPEGHRNRLNAMPPEIIKKRAYRSYQFVATAPRTFYAKLFQAIKKEDLLFEGKFLPMAWDLAIMFPMLEMASPNHFVFLPDNLYIYNMQNPINDHKVSRELQIKLDRFVRQKKAYKPMKKLFN